MELDRHEIVTLTEQYGGEWGLRHSERLLRLVARIAGDDAYDSEAVWLAAYLHDWGGYEAWALPSTDHTLRSAEVAERFLRERGICEVRLAVVLEAIRTHHVGGPDRSIEAKLISDADMLDLLGTVGVLRTFSMKARDLRGGYEAATKRREELPGLLCMNQSKGLAKTLVREMEGLLNAFERDSCGLF